MNDINYYKKYEPIDGKWYLEKQLGQGAYGTVFQVVRKDFGEQRAALKMISIPASQNEVDSFRQEHYELDEQSVTSYFYGFVEEFVKEFQLMATLKGHSNIVSYEDHDVKAKDGEFGWDIFIRMELLTPMTDYFKDHTPTQADVIKIGIDICKALEVCNKHNIIHRDIKPANIFISGDGNYKLGDFGVARTLEKTSSGLSKKGTYIYMAPEVYKGESYNLTVDLYSLGILMYRQLNDNFEPFRTSLAYSDGENAMERRMRGERFQGPRYASPALSAVILRACEYNSRDRFQSPAEMRQALEAIIAEPTSGSTTVLQGYAVPPVAPPPPIGEQKRFCTSCGASVKEGQNFCTNCNAPLNDSARKQNPAEPSVKPVDPPSFDSNATVGVGRPMAPGANQNDVFVSAGQVIGGYSGGTAGSTKVKQKPAGKPRKKGNNHPIIAALLLIAAVVLFIPTIEYLLPALSGEDLPYQDFLFCIHLIVPAIALLLISVVLFIKREKGLNLVLIIAIVLVAAAVILGVNLFFSYIINKNYG